MHFVTTTVVFVVLSGASVNTVVQLDKLLGPWKTLLSAAACSFAGKLMLGASALAARGENTLGEHCQIHQSAGKAPLSNKGCLICCSHNLCVSPFLYLKGLQALVWCVRQNDSKQTCPVTEHMLIISVLFCLKVPGPKHTSSNILTDRSLIRQC